MKTRWFQQIGLTLISGLLATACSSDTQQSATGQPLLLNNFPTQQQTTDYTCGCVAALMVMHYYQVDDATEEELAIQMHTHVDGETPGAQPGSAVRLTDYGTNPQELWQYFHNRKDFQIVASSYRPDSSLPRLTDEARVGIQAVDNVDRTFLSAAVGGRSSDPRLLESVGRTLDRLHRLQRPGNTRQLR